MLQLRKRLPKLSLVSFCTLFAAHLLSAAPIPANRMPAAGWEGKVGVPGGIPTNYTQFCNVKIAIPGYVGALAVGDGVADDTAAIQAAVNLCPNNQFVYIPAGDYKVTSEIYRVGVNNFDFVNRPYSFLIRGAGPSQTRILNYNSSSGGNVFGFYNASSIFPQITAGNTRGSTSITMAANNLGYMQSGLYASVLRSNAESGFVATGTNSYMGNACSQIVKITALNGNVLTIDPALNEGYASDSLEIGISCPTRCGVEDLYIEHKTNTAGHGIFFTFGQECWVKNVESNEVRNWHIRFEASARCEVRNCYLHDTWDGGGNSGYGVGLFRYSCNNLIENNVFERCRHSMILEYGGQGNVFGYNYSKDPINENGPNGQNPNGRTDYMMGDIITHGGNPRFNLWEGNIAGIIRFDNILGGADYNTAFRNRIQRKGLIQTIIACFGSDIQRNTYNSVLMGNIYELRPALSVSALRRWGSTDDVISNTDAQSQATTIVDGDYDMTTSSISWAGADQTLRQSYYLTGQAKPGFFGTLAFPPVDPTAPAAVAADTIPAIYKYLHGTPPPTKPYLLSPLADISVQVGSNATFTSAFDGFPAPTYVWKKNNVVIPLATDATLTLTAVPVIDTGAVFTVIATNASGFTVANDATLTVTGGTPASITVQPASTPTVVVDQAITLSVTAAGSPTPTYQWKKGVTDLVNGPTGSGSVISGATTAQLTITGAKVTDLGAYTVIVSNSAGSPVTSNISALTVTKATPTITTAPTAGAIVFGQTLALSNLTGGSASVAGTFSFTIPGTAPAVGAGQSMAITFAPTDSANYNTAAGTTAVTVNKATPTITTAPTTTALTYGQALSASTLSGGVGSVAGTFAFTTPATIPVVGTNQSVGITFTPTASSNYNNATSTTTITVAKATPTITTAPSASTIGVGQALSASILSGGVASVPGTFAFTTPGTVLALGAAQSVGVTFTPTDTANYNTATTTASVTVSNAPPVKQTPTLTTLPAASPITAGQALSASILSGGVASVPGSFAFTNPSDTPATTQAVSVTFTPLITATVNTVQTTVMVTVNPAGKAPTVTSSKTATGTVGTSFSYTITAADAPTAFSASGLPAGLTFNATTGVVSGTPTAAGAFSMTVGASNAIGSNTATVALNVAQGTQSISFTGTAGSVVVGQPVTLVATATSGLPVTFTLVSGAATISGNTLTITTVGGVVVRASQAGNANYAAAASAVVTITVTPTQIYFGKMGGDDFAATVTGVGAGRLFVLISSTNEALIVDFTLNADGTFTSAIPGTATSSSGGDESGPARAAAGTTRTFRGKFVNGVLTGSVEELGLSFNGNAQPASGNTAGLSGAYTAGSTGSSGTTYLIVGTQGQTYALSTSAGAPLAGVGTINANGSFTVTTPKGTLSGTADATTTAITGTLQTSGTTLSLVGIGATTTRTDRVVNLSTRGHVFANDPSRAFIAGFVVSGTGSKQVLLRAVGPTLGSLGVTDALANPSLQLFNSRGVQIGQNDGWNNAADLDSTGARVGAFKLAASSRDSAILSTLDPGAYTLVISSAAGSGTALAEVYDASSNPGSATQQLTNISTRGFVEPGEGFLTAGFAITGNSPKKVLIRGVGPSLTPFGVTGALADPALSVTLGGVVIAENDNWETAKPLNATQRVATSIEIAAAASSVGAFALLAGGKDAATVLTLAPGNYTATVSGSTSGSALVEVYELP